MITNHKLVNKILNAYDVSFKKKDYIKGYELLSKIIKFNSPDCFWRLAEMYEYGYGVKKNFKIAIAYYQKAVSLGDIRWYSDIGNLYRKQRKFYSAKKYFLLGVKYNQVLSFYYLGNIYEFGKGVKKNKSKAIYYFFQASNRGNLFAKLRFAKYLSSGGGGFIKRICGYFLIIKTVTIILILTIVNVNDERLDGM